MKKNYSKINILKERQTTSAFALNQPNHVKKNYEHKKKHTKKNISKTYRFQCRVKN